MNHTSTMLNIIGLSNTYFLNIKAKSGQTTLFHPLAVVQKDSIIFDTNNLPIIGSLGLNNRRKLFTTTGDQQVVVVRVIAPDASTSQTEAELSDNIFGTSGDPMNLRSG